MLKPAILYKEEIIKGFQEYFYTDDMMFETGCMNNWCPDISEEPDESTFQFAIVLIQSIGIQAKRIILDCFHLIEEM